MNQPIFKCNECSTVVQAKDLVLTPITMENYMGDVKAEPSGAVLCICPNCGSEDLVGI